MRVVISGYYGFDNLGDEAILKSIIMALKEADKNIEITVLSSNPTKTKENYNVKAINRWNMNKIYRAIKSSDGVISGGGSLLQDVTSSRNILYYTAIMGMANYLNKPVFIYAQGVGPIYKNLNKKIVKHFLNKVQYISLRDEESFDLIKSIGVTTTSKVVPDPVMGLDFKNINIKNNNENYIVVSVRDWNTKTEYLKEIAKACDDISKTGIGIKLLPMHGKLDEETSIKMAEMMNSKVEILSNSIDIENKLKYIKGAKLVIAMRLHALIFAGNVGTPMIGVSYDPKIESYLKLVKQPCIGNVNENIEADKLTKEALYVIETYREVKNKLEENTNSLKLTAKLTANQAVEIFKNYKGEGERHE